MKLTNEIIIERSIKIYGKDRFDYSKLIYKNKRVKIDLTCNLDQTPFKILVQNHLKANKETGGCPTCLKKWRKNIFPRIVSTKATKWTKEKILDEAKKYNSRSDFSKKANGAYKKAKEKGYLDEVCAHMPKRNCFLYSL